MENYGPPTFNEENAVWQSGYNRIAGIDEVGRGRWQGGGCSRCHYRVILKLIGTHG